MDKSRGLHKDQCVKEIVNIGQQELALHLTSFYLKRVLNTWWTEVGMAVQQSTPTSFLKSETD